MSRHLPTSLSQLTDPQRVCDIRRALNTSAVVRTSARRRCRCQRQVTDDRYSNVHRPPNAALTTYSPPLPSSLVMVSSLPPHTSAQILPNLVQKSSDLELLKVCDVVCFLRDEPCNLAIAFAYMLNVDECTAQHLLPLLDGQHHVADIIWAASVSRETLDKLIAEHKEFLVKTLRL